VTPEGGPQEPLSELVEGAVAAHEMFLAYKEAGFTDNQALYLVASIVTAGIKPPQQP
jgi:hypothetical protein